MSDHRMMVAKPSPHTAHRYGLNPNHHLRVWCVCLEDAASDPGTYAGQHWQTRNDRTAKQAANDPRRCGMWDELGVVDMRVPGSAVALFRQHVREATA